MRAASLLVLAALGACSSQPAPCPEGSKEVEGVCRASCAGGFPCLASESCVDGVCVPGVVSTPDAGLPDASPMGCTLDENCGPARTSPLEECRFEAECAAEGRQRVQTITPRCKAGVCSEDVAESTVGCRRDPEGASCGPTEEGPWSDCGAPTECGLQGETTRTVVVKRCHDGACRSGSMTERMGCARRIPNGQACINGSGMCCDGQCVQNGDSQHCGVCGVHCPDGTCVGLGGGRFSCGCTRDRECEGFGYGPGTTCQISAAGQALVCQCPCDNGMACSGACGDGVCMRQNLLTWCDYP